MQQGIQDVPKMAWRPQRYLNILPGWGVGATPAGQKSKQWGDLWMACSHTDSKGSVWTTYW